MCIHIIILIYNSKTMFIILDSFHYCAILYIIALKKRDATPFFFFLNIIRVKLSLKGKPGSFP